MDETYLGASEAGVHGRQLVGKALVVIAIELTGAKVGRVRLRHVPDGSASSLVGFIQDVVKVGAMVHTDGWQGYAGLSKTGYAHRVTRTRGRAMARAPNSDSERRRRCGRHLGPWQLERLAENNRD